MDSSAKSAIALVEDPTTLLSAIQIGITLLTIFTGLYGGETFAGPLAEKLTAYGVPTEYTEELAKGIVVLIITFVTLIVGEIVPKRVALLHAETLALRVAPTMRVMARITAPALPLAGKARPAPGPILQRRHQQGDREYGRGRRAIGRAIFCGGEAAVGSRAPAVKLTTRRRPPRRRRCRTERRSSGCEASRC